MRITLYLFIFLIIPFGSIADENLKKSRVCIEELGSRVITEVENVQISP